MDPTAGSSHQHLPSLGSPPPTHGSASVASQKPATTTPNAHEPPPLTASSHDRDANEEHLYPRHLSHIFDKPESPRVKHHHHRHLSVDPPGLDIPKLRPRHKHKHSKSRDGLFPRKMNQIASSTAARGLLQTWSSGREKDNEDDDGLLRPITRESTRSRWGSDSTTGFGTGSRKGSIFEDIDQSNVLGSVKRQEIRTMQDLGQVKDRRKQGEEYLRTALSLIGTLATDITRRLDYTYYNLLEKIAALTTTVASFQELSDSTSALYGDFERETTNLEQEVRRQVGELNEFEPQIRKIEALEERMKAGRTRADAISTRLEKMRNEVDLWEKKEVEWQARVNKRLRLFWGIILTALLASAIVIAIRNWPTESPGLDFLSQSTLDNHSMRSFLRVKAEEAVEGSSTSGDGYSWSLYPSNLAQYRTNHQTASSASKSTAGNAKQTDQDPLRIFDEL